jgi:hypothetical protein
MIKMYSQEKWLQDIDERVERAKRDYAGPHCCLTMEKSLEVYKDTFTYNPETKIYGAKHVPSSVKFDMVYCPFCRKLLENEK